MAHPLLEKQYKTNWANGLWDIHKTQARVHRLVQSAQTDASQPVDPQGGIVSTPAATPTGDPDGVSVDSNNPITHNYPPPVVVMPPAPPAPPAPKSNLPAALVLASAIAAGAWLFSRPAPAKPDVPAPPPATTPISGSEWDVNFFDP